MTMPMQLGNRPKGQPFGDRGEENAHDVLCQRGKLNRNGASGECRPRDVAHNSDDGRRQGQCSDHGTRPAQAGRLAVELRAVGGFGGADHVGCKHYRADQQDTGQRRGPLVGQDESRMQRFRSPRFCRGDDSDGLFKPGSYADSQLKSDRSE
jgi:hypothetical protein